MGMIMFSSKMWLVFFMCMQTLCLAQKCSLSDQNKDLVTALSKGNLKFAINAYKSLADNENVFLSPFSISVALAMTTAGAGGNTLAQMKTVLNLQELQNSNQTNNAFFSILDSICSNSNYTLSTANRIYLRNNFPVEEQFLNALTNSYKSGAENVEFGSSSDDAASKISRWVSQQTNGIIKDLFPKGSLDASVVLVLVNAIYFKGTWLKSFDLRQTVSEDFKLVKGQSPVSVPMMGIKDRFNYTEYAPLSSKVLQLNYAGDRLVMYIILPDKTDGLTQLQQQLSPEHFNSIQKQLSLNEVRVKIPKFKLRFRQQLNSMLQGLGMTDVFSETTANLSGISKAKDQKLYVSNVIHEAFVDVNEEGTTAAAATGVSVSLTSLVIDPKPEITFIADHPFMFAIYDTLTELILFMGNVNNPKV